MKETQAAEDYPTRSHKEIVAVFITFNRATYLSLNSTRNFNFNFKTKTSSAVSGLALRGHLMMPVYDRNMP
jgi:hypothetical protein